MRNIKGQLLTYGSNGRLPSRKQLIESTSLSDSKTTEASTSLSMDDFLVVDSAALPSTSRVAEVRSLFSHSMHTLKQKVGKGKLKYFAQYYRVYIDWIPILVVLTMMNA